MNVELKGRILERLLKVVGQSPSDEFLDLHQRYVSLLTKWNRTINLTSLQLEPISDEAIDRLLVEPIAASALAGEPKSIIDIGTGGGSPAIPFWVQLPESNLTMVESRSRKCAFLREAVRQIRPGKGTAIEARFEDLLVKHPELIASADVVTVRAVRLDDQTTALIGDLLKPTGQVFHFAHELEVFDCSTWNNRGKKPGSS